MSLSRATPASHFPDAFQGDAIRAPSLFGQTINDVAPLMGGTADRGCLVLVSIGGAVFGVTANDEGEWSLDTGIEVPLSGRFDLGTDGPKKLVVTVFDSCGRSCAVQGEFTILTTAPEIPTLSTVRVFHHRPLLAGHAEPGSRLAVSLGGATYVVTVAGSGTWRLDTATQEAVEGRLALGADGPKPVFLISTDIAGNTSSATVSLMLDTSTGPKSPAVVSVPGLADSKVIGRSFQDTLIARRCSLHHPKRS